MKPALKLPPLVAFTLAITSAGTATGTAHAAEEHCVRGHAVKSGSVEDRAIPSGARFVWFIEQEIVECPRGSCNGRKTKSYFIELVDRRSSNGAIRFPFSEPQILDVIRGPNGERSYRYRYDLHLQAKKKRGGIFSFWKTFADATPVYHRGVVRPGDEQRGQSVRMGRLKDRVIDNYTFRVDATPSQPVSRVRFNFWKLDLEDHVSVSVDGNRACIRF